MSQSQLHQWRCTFLKLEGTWVLQSNAMSSMDSLLFGEWFGNLQYVLVDPEAAWDRFCPLGVSKFYFGLRCSSQLLLNIQMENRQKNVINLSSTMQKTQMRQLQVEMGLIWLGTKFLKTNEFEYNIIKVSKSLCHFPHQLHSYFSSHDKEQTLEINK